MTEVIINSPYAAAISFIVAVFERLTKGPRPTSAYTSLAAAVRAHSSAALPLSSTGLIFTFTGHAHEHVTVLSCEWEKQTAFESHLKIVIFNCKKDKKRLYNYSTKFVDVCSSPVFKWPLILVIFIDVLLRLRDETNLRQGPHATCPKLRYFIFEIQTADMHTL